MISLRNFALRRGGRLLLSQVDVVLHAGWKLGVVGRNGCGKSSLFAAFKGELDADAGALALPANLRLACVDQETPALPDAAIDYVLGGDVEVAAALAEEARADAAGDHAAVAVAHHRIEELNGYDARARAGRLLHGLGFKADTHERAVASFSGGWRVRLNLARALMAPSDLLLLDEPTNHLDLDAVLWLEQWLRRYPGMLLVISHDREFLDGVVSHVLHLDQGRAKLYSGNYSDFERQRSEHLRQQQIAHDKEQVERAHLQSFIDRFKAKASKAKQAQSRVKRLEKLAGTEAVRAERAFHFAFPAPERLPQSMLTLDHVDAGYILSPLPPGEGTRRAGEGSGEERNTESRPSSSAGSARTLSPTPLPRGEGLKILDDVRFGLQAGDRIGLLGPNGAGKSTLVKTLVGELPLLAGARTAHKDLRIGYFAQHTVESLRAGESPFQHLSDMAPRASAQELRDWLGSWNFAGERAFEPVEGFSGGERARLALALIAWHKPNLLLLDEPTNHLDLDMREALADALNDFPGALVLVSHDRHLLGLVCDAYWRVADGAVVPFDGDLDDYARWLRSRNSGSGSVGNRDAGAGTAPITLMSARERRQAGAQQREQIKPLRRRVQQVEARMTAIDVELRALETQLADPQVYAGPTGRMAELGQRQADLRREHAALEAEWLAVYAQLESLSA